MCTVACRWSPATAFPVAILALRDERRSRSFDLPGEWWPEHGGVIGGRDQQASGSWCVCAIATGVTALVLNRPERREAASGAPSRGVLPLLAIEHGTDWADYIELAGMASFNVVLAEPDALTWWSYDGAQLERFALAPGTHVVTPRGLATAPDARLPTATISIDGHLDATTEDVWGDWLLAVRDAEPNPDPGQLLVRRQLDDGDWYETVFGQLIAARPGTLRIDYQVAPARRGTWTTRLWRSAPGN